MNDAETVGRVARQWRDEARWLPMAWGLAAAAYVVRVGTALSGGPVRAGLIDPARALLRRGW